MGKTNIGRTTIGIHEGLFDPRSHIHPVRPMINNRAHQAIRLHVLPYYVVHSSSSKFNTIYVKEIQGANQRAILLTHITYRSHIIPGPQARSISECRVAHHLSQISSTLIIRRAFKYKLAVACRFQGGGGGLCVWTALWVKKPVLLQGIREWNQRTDA